VGVGDVVKQEQPPGVPASTASRQAHLCWEAGNGNKHRGQLGWLENVKVPPHLAETTVGGREGRQQGGRAGKDTVQVRAVQVTGQGSTCDRSGQYRSGQYR
jgi:hypothetical protein